MYFFNSPAIQGSGPIWMDEVTCHEQATRLTECSFDGWRVHDCTHGEDVAVRCGKIKPELEPLDNMRNIDMSDYDY